jgi:[ribulose-bisphosphate carboxylase]-lysine N-methyltransferase
VEDDRKVAEDPGVAASDPRRRLAARVRMGEKNALSEVLGFYTSVEAGAYTRSLFSST